MKELYKPVFWCGFALSLSALYASSERAISGEVSEPQKPILMNINIGQATEEKVDSGVVERSQMIAGESIITAPVVSEEPVPIEIDLEPAPPISAPAGTSVFFSAAQETLGNN